MATVTTNLSRGLLKDYKTAFDPLSPVDLSATTLDDDITLGPMIRFVKFCNGAAIAGLLFRIS